MTAFNSDYYKRAKRRVYVTRGFDGCEPTTYTRQAAVTAGQTIKSGMLIALVSGEWVKYDAVAHKALTPYIALSDDTDTDVTSSGLLPAISCAGKFEIETAYYDVSGGTLVGDDIAVVGSATDGQVTEGDIATAGATIIGFTARGGLQDLNGPAANGNYGPKIEVNAEDGNILVFRTNWQPFVATA